MSTEIDRLNAERKKLLERILSSEKVQSLSSEALESLNKVLSVIDVAIEHSDIIPGFLPAFANLDQIKSLSFRAYESVQAFHAGDHVPGSLAH